MPLNFVKCNGITELEKMKFICVELFMKYLRRQGRLKMNNNGNYCIIVENINFYPEYNHLENKMVEKNIKFMEIIKEIANQYLEGEYRIELEFKDNDMIFYFCEKRELFSLVI